MADQVHISKEVPGPASEPAGGESAHQFGLTAAMALIVGSIIGVGIFNLPTSLDVLDAGTQGMIGYLIQQELRSLLPPDRQVATLLTMITVDPHDPGLHPADQVRRPGLRQGGRRRPGRGEGLGVQAGRHRLAAGGTVPPAPPDPGDRADLLADIGGIVAGQAGTSVVPQRAPGGPALT